MFLNGFEITFSGTNFTANVIDMPDPSDLKSLRSRCGDEWFLHWRGGKAFAIPKVESPSSQLGTPTSFEVSSHDALHLLTARISQQLPELFEGYEAFRRQPFSFLGKREELVQLVTGKWKGLPELIQYFTIRPKFELDTRIVEVRDGETRAALILSLDMKWSISASLDDLDLAGVDLRGLNVVRRDPGPDERRLVGTIKSVVNQVVHLSEAYDDLEQIGTNQVWLEGSRVSFSRCLRHLLGTRYDDFDTQRVAKESEFLTGPALDSIQRRMGQFIGKASTVPITKDLSCDFGERVELTNTTSFQSVVSFSPVEYCFDAANSKRDRFPWPGIRRFGPFDRDTFSRRTPKVLVIFPDDSAGHVSQFIKVFRDGIQSISNSQFPNGFATTFGLVNPQFVNCSVPVMGNSSSNVADKYRKAIEDHLASHPDQYDIALVAIRDTHGDLPNNINPYLHSKAVLLMNGIPVQEVRVGTITKPHSALQWILPNIAVAMYAKMGGIPWTVAHDMTVDDELVIGLGMAELTGSRFENRQRHMGITTVFRGDGNYLLSNVSKTCMYRDYPDVLRDSTAQVLRDVKQRNGWRPGDTVRVVFHAYKPLKRVEVASIVNHSVQEVGSEQHVEFAFLTVSHEHPFKLIDTAQSGKHTQYGTKGQFVPERGTMGQLGRYTRLLCTNGPNQIKRATTPLPSPLLVHLHPESTYRDLAYLTEQVLKFTSLTWRSTQPARRPVSIYYSELIARILARLGDVPGWSPAVLNTRLRTSRWFL